MDYNIQDSYGHDNEGHDNNGHENEGYANKGHADNGCHDNDHDKDLDGVHGVLHDHEGVVVREVSAQKVGHHTLFWAKVKKVVDL